MRRVFAVLRRIFLAGLVSLLVCLFLLHADGSAMLAQATAHDSAAGYVSIWFLASPFLYLLSLLISTAYIRRNGQFAAFHQTQSPITSFFKCLGSDLISPFRNIKNFVFSLFSKTVFGRGVIICRFIGLVILILVCAFGINALMY